MNIIKTSIEGVAIIEPRIFKDDRGYFFESFSQKEFDEKVCKIAFVQDNESKSSYGVLRGLHYQKTPYAQSKLVRVIKGRVLDVAVDIRKKSPTFGKHVGVELSEGAIAWNDPELNIDWKIPEHKIVLSEKDKLHPLLKDATDLFDYNENLYK